MNDRYDKVGHAQLNRRAAQSIVDKTQRAAMLSATEPPARAHFADAFSTDRDPLAGIARSALLGTPATFAPTSGAPRLLDSAMITSPNDGSMNLPETAPPPSTDAMLHGSRRPGTFLIKVDDAAIDRGEQPFLRFIGPNERVDVADAPHFMTLSQKELDEMVGHPVLVGDDGKPILGDNDFNMVAALILLRFRIVENPNMTHAQKRRALDDLRDKPAVIGGIEVIPPDGEGVETFKVTKILDHVEGQKEEPSKFDRRMATVDKSKVEELLGRKIGRTADGKYHDLRGGEAEFLGTTMGTVDALRDAVSEGAPPNRLDDILIKSIEFIRQEYGVVAAKRATAFLRRERFKSRAELTKRLAELDSEIIDVKKQIVAGREVQTWLLDIEREGIRLQRPDGSALHKLREACQARGIIPLFVDTKMPERLAHSFDGIAHAFVIEHNWSAAFTGSAEFDEGDVGLPFPICAFEFQINGRRACLVLQEHDTGGETIALLLVRARCGWILICSYVYSSGRLTAASFPLKQEALVKTIQPIADTLGANIRAVSITLEAEITKTEVVRIDHKLNRAREKRGKLPLSDYHVVSLARRTRYLPREKGQLEEGHEITRRRLHFRRGHFRHYEKYKLWIKWMLVGDPELGFVDKEYRL